VKQTFASVYADPNGYANLAKCYLMINTGAAVSWLNGAIVLYDANANLLYLLNDAGASWGTGYAPGSANVLENSQCKLYCAETTKSASGNNLTVNWKIEFKPAVSGQTRKAWLYAIDDGGLNSTWIAKGDITIN